MRFKLTDGCLLAVAIAIAPGCGSATGSAAPVDAVPDAANGTNAPLPAAPSGATMPVSQGADAASSVSPVDSSPPDPGVDAMPPGPALGNDAAVERDAPGREATAATADATAPSGPLADAAMALDAGTPPTSAFTCTLLIGIQATEEWYIAGFETIVDNSRWELMWVHSGFVELWANPNDPVWSTAITSPCAQNADKPDRVIFVPLNYLNDTLTFWTPNVAAAVANIQAKYPSAKRIELMTFIRAPGNVACSQAPAPRSTITPAQDQAMAMAAAANPGLVVVAPKFEAKTCSEYSSNPPHPTAAGATAWATMLGDYYR